jgi:hypothetical protein
MIERYYVKVKGAEGSRCAHDTLAEAYTEARRLFDLIGRNRRVYVLQVIGTVEPEDGTAVPQTKPTRGTRRRGKTEASSEAS